MHLDANLIKMGWQMGFKEDTIAFMGAAFLNIKWRFITS